MNNETNLTKSIPVLAALDLAKTLEFYAERLKFTPHIQTNDYAGVKRDGIEIHFWLCNDRHIAENTGCRIQVTNVEPLYAEYQAAEVIHPNGALAEKPWGFREFAISDCNGNLITFAEPLEKVDAKIETGDSESTARCVTGIGGIFFKAQDEVKLREWYKTHLGIKLESFGGSMFEWRDAVHTERKGTTIWSIFSHDTQYLNPSTKPFMINYRVENLDAVLAYLRSAGVEVDDRIEDSEFGRFGWAMDIEGNRLELWQPPEGL
ncbi:MAG: hypothetical protein AB1757_20170 [Acidobacteriota bacterium]